MGQKKRHLFHLVDYSPWPLLVSLGAFFFIMFIVITTERIELSIIFLFFNYIYFSKTNINFLPKTIKDDGRNIVSYFMSKQPTVERITASKLKGRSWSNYINNKQNPCDVSQSRILKHISFHQELTGRERANMIHSFNRSTISFYINNNVIEFPFTNKPKSVQGYGAGDFTSNLWLKGQSLNGKELFLCEPIFLKREVLDERNSIQGFSSKVYDITAGGYNHLTNRTLISQLDCLVNYCGTNGITPEILYIVINKFYGGIFLDPIDFDIESFFNEKN